MLAPLRRASALATRCVLQSRGISASPSARAGLGQPVGTAGPATSALPDEHELIWDDGSKHPEPCLDNPAPMLSTETTALWLAGGFAVFGAVAAAAAYNDKASKVPFGPRAFPYPLPFESKQQAGVGAAH